MLDWSDGALARLRGTTSELGRILDIWGAHVNNISFTLSFLCMFITMKNILGHCFY